MDKIWAAVAGCAAILLGIFGIHRAGRNSAKNEVAAESSRKAMNVKDRARAAEREGEQKQREIKDADVNPRRRDFFE